MALKHKFKTVASALVWAATATFLLSGCVSEEKITPSFPVERLEDQFNNSSPLMFYIPIQKVQVADEFQQVGSIRHIGGAFRRLAEMIADVSIERGQTGTLDLDPIDYDLKELEEIDFAFVKEVLLQNVHVVMDEEKANKETSSGTVSELTDRRTAASFSFIKSLEVYIKMDDLSGSNSPTVVPNSKGPGAVLDKALKEETTANEARVLPDRYLGSALALSYYKGLNDMSCAGKCFDMMVHQGNWKQMLKKNKKITLLVRLSLDHAPKFSFSFIGHLLVKVLVNLNGI